MNRNSVLGRWGRIILRMKRSFLNDGLSWPQRLVPAPVANVADSTRVLVATSVAGHLTALNLESLLAKALTMRGGDVAALLCDRALPACMDCQHLIYPTRGARKSFVRHGPVELCMSCTRVGVRIYGDLGIPVLLYGQYLSAQDRDEAKRIASQSHFDDIRSFEHEGLAVGEHAYAGALRFFARGDIEGEPLAEEIVRRYFEAALLTVFMMRNLLKVKRFDVCVVNHGIYVPQGLIAEVCREQGVRVVTWNPAYRMNCFIFSHGVTYHHTLMTEPVTNWEDMRWNEEIESELMRYLNSRLEGDCDWIWFHYKPQFDLSAIQQELGIDFSRPTIGLLTNVVWDAQLHYPANAFPGIIEWIMETISWFSRHPELQLVIRVHPAEIRGTLPARQRVVDEITKHFPLLPKNVFVIPPESHASTYAVMAQCDSVIIYGTKTGVELTSMGIPVIVVGEAWIRNKGVTLDVSSVDEYLQMLGRLPLGERMASDKIKRARKYAYHFFFRRMIPLPFMKPRKGWPSFAPELDSAGQLLPDNFGGLDVICDGILKGSEFIYPAEAHVNANSSA